MEASRKPSLWQVYITTTPEAEDASVEALANEFGATASCYVDFETQVALASVYLDQRPGNLERRMKSVRARLLVAKANGVEVGAATVRCRQVKRENWAESWKRHFKPLSIGGSLLLKPGWSRRKPKPGQAVVVLNPGLSFGTGHHATTSFCLREVVRFARSGGGSFLDIGTGSGILAIAAAKLGCSPIEAFDFDPEAVRVARENARQNRVQQRLSLFEGDVTKLPSLPKLRFDLVCANLISNLLMAERKRIAARVAPGGTLVLAGILQIEFHKVRESFEALGFQLVRQRDEREWSSGAFVWAPR
jgi:ribosomal protein L11 methyltransferase